MDTVAKLFALAGAKKNKKAPKRKKKKFPTDVENSWDEVYDYFVNTLGM